MKNQVARILNLPAIRQNLLGVDIILFKPRTCLGAALKPKLSPLRFESRRGMRREPYSQYNFQLDQRLPDGC